VLILLLALVLPARGVAALLCLCPGGAQAPIAASAHTGAAHDHAGHAAHSHADHGSHPTHDHASHDQDSRLHGGCSACASCCLALWIPAPPDPSLGNVGPQAHLPSAAPSILLGTMPSGMERPPRSS